jgi:preprotein translocase subunit SecG
MYILVIVLHVLACTALILIVLLQKGKGADLGAAFGGASQTVFGSAGAGGFLTKLTTASAVIFMFTCLSLAYLSAHRAHETVMQKVETNVPAAKADAVQEKAVPDEKASAAAQGAETGSTGETSSTAAAQGEQKQ